LSFKFHPSEDLLEEYAFQHLSEEQSAPLEEHLLVCATCQHALVEIDRYLLLMKRGSERRLFGLSRGKLRRLPCRGWIPNFAPNLAWTTAGALACLAAAIYLSHRPPESVPIAPIPIALMSLRDGGETISAPRGAPLELQLDPGDSPSAATYRVEIVTSSGKRVWSDASKLGGRKLEAEVASGLGSGCYWVRLYYESETLRSETGLLVQ
jgi:hypothetical protein